MSDRETRSPFDRLPGESPRAFAAFVAYRDLGPGRSLDAACRQLGGQRESNKRATTGRVGKWSSRYKWVERCRAYDAHQEAIRQRAIDAELAREAAKWERRRLQQIEHAWELGVALREKALAMLDWPLATERTEDATTIVEPARWTFATVVPLLRLAHELQFASLAAATKGLEDMTDAELEAVASVDFPGTIPLHASPEEACWGGTRA
jgi:hypothetical protein